jgi:hypothetical protein
MYKAYQILTPLQKNSNSGYDKVTTIKSNSINYIILLSKDNNINIF